MARDPSEVRLFRSYWNDGLIDLVCGLGVVGIGVCWALGLPVFGAVIPALLVPLWGPLHAALIEPRAGYVEFSRRRRHRVSRGLGLSVALGIVVLLASLTAWSLARGGPVPELARWSAALPALLLAVPAALAAWLLGAPRFLLYALAFVASAPLTVALAWPPSTAMIGVGALVSASGVTLMARFLRSSRAWAEGAT
jgi:hypothetical protein